MQGDQGVVRGAAFPSAHVSGTVAWTIVAYRFLPRFAGHLMLFISIGTAVSSVYLGYHHAVDPIGGILLAVAAYPVALGLVRWRRRVLAGQQDLGPGEYKCPPASHYGRTPR